MIFFNEEPGTGARNGRMSVWGGGPAGDPNSRHLFALTCVTHVLVEVDFPPFC